MEDFSFKIYEIEENKNHKKIIKIVLIGIACLFTLLIFIKIFKVIFSSNTSETQDGITLIKAQKNSVKRVPDEKGGLNIENLDIGVYDVLDDNEKDDVEPTIKKTSQGIAIKDGETFKTQNLNDQDLLSDKIDEINQNDKISIRNSTDKHNTNITINTEQTQPANFDDLKKLGNNSLIRNLKDKKYIKPGVRVQLLALKSRKSVETYWDEITSKYSTLFNDKTYYIEKIDLNEATSIYRLQVGMFANIDKANSFCQEYIKNTNKNKVDCIVVK
ncbi:MAG: SPOR domain-containing protein [Rickettsiales bacterium]|nr:SPOR domain-containing protein [Rickettsiales bacterium]